MDRARVRFLLHRLDTARSMVAENRPGYIRDMYSSIVLLEGADLTPAEQVWYDEIVSLCVEHQVIMQDIVDSSFNTGAFKSEAQRIALLDPKVDDIECPDGFLVMSLYDLLLVSGWMSETSRTEILLVVSDVLEIIRTHQACFQNSFSVARSILGHAPEQTDTQKIARNMLLRLIEVG